MGYENLTTFTEVDPNTRWSQTTTQNSGVQIPRNETSYVYKDYGASYFADFEHHIDIQTSGVHNDFARVIFWAVSDSIGSPYDTGDRIYLLNWRYSNADHLRLYVNGSYSGEWTFAAGQWKYLKIIRSNTSVECRCYSSSADRDTDSDRQATLSYTCPTTAYRYLYVGSSCNTGDSDNISLDIANVLIAPPPEIDGSLQLSLLPSSDYDLSYDDYIGDIQINLIPESQISKIKIYDGTLVINLSPNSDTFSSYKFVGDISINITPQSDYKIAYYKYTGDLDISLIPSSAYYHPWGGSYCSRIIHTNPLIVICDTDPVKLIRIDIGSAGDITSKCIEILDASGEIYKNAKDVCFNDTFDYLYIACADGLIAKIDSTNLNSREEISVSDTDDLTNIVDSEEFYKTFVATENVNAELYEIDEATMVSFNSDFRITLPFQETFDSVLHYIETKKIKTDFRYLDQTRTKVKTDFRYLDHPYDEIPPTPQYIPASDNGFVIKIDGTEVIDFESDSIQIRWIAEEKSTTQFILRRYHDKLNYTLEGVSSQITNKNGIVIYINGIEVFTGKIDTLDCSGQEEYVQVSCVGTIRNPNYVTINLPLPTLNEQLHLYHVLNNSVNIKKFIADYDEEDNPSIYKGIKIDLGIEEKETVSKYSSFLNRSTLAEKIEDGTWRPEANWTYFFFASANLLDPFIPYWRRTIDNKYIGTSLGSLSDDLWQLTGVSYYYQRTFDNIETELGYYYLGSSPYKEVSSKNGRYIAKKRWEDREDGFYVVKNKHWDYIDYTKAVADMEYEKMKDSNGIVPSDPNYVETTATVSLTIDGFLYYNLGLLTKINITNTVESGIYKNNNGFPLRIKTLAINSSNMQVSIIADNQKTEAELEALENEVYPTEPEVIEEYAQRRNPKFDPNRYEEVE